jgi:hypothetical protein
VFSCFVITVICGRFTVGLMTFSVLVDILVCLLQGCEASELEQRVEQW